MDGFCLLCVLGYGFCYIFGKILMKRLVSFWKLKVSSGLRFLNCLSYRSTMSWILTIRQILEGVHAKNLGGNNIICWLRQGLWLHTQREDGPDTNHLRPTKKTKKKKKRRSCNDAIKKHKSKSLLLGWRHRLLQHCSRCTARRHVSPIPLYHLSRLCA